MDIYYKVNMSNQWRFGIGIFVDLNCGWYCQDGLLSWYCTKHRLPESLFKNTQKHKRGKYGFNPAEGYCLKMIVPRTIHDFEKYLLKYGPVILAGNIAGPFSCFGHYVLAVGVRGKTNDIIVYDPISVDFRNIRGTKPSLYKFDSYIKKVDEVLVLNEYSLKALAA